MIGGEGMGEATSASTLCAANVLTRRTLRTRNLRLRKNSSTSYATSADAKALLRGHRWFDLGRWGMPSFTHKWHDNAESTSTFRIEENDLLYTVPIPDEALQMNSSLEQNELPDKRTPIVE